MGLAENKAIVVNHFKDVVEGRRLDLIESYYALPFDTPERFHKWLEWLYKHSDGPRVTVLDVLAEGDKVTIFFQVDITYKPEFAAEYTSTHPPLGQPYSWKGMEIYRIADGKMVSRVGVYDPANNFPARKSGQALE
jgi:hypothetical protein